MARNLDMTALRAFVTVAEVGGVTRAAGVLNLTQSAVSMQLKRLEESLGVNLLDRSSRSIGLTAEGEQLLGYGQRILSINDDAFARLTATEFTGELKLGVPHDLIYPSVPPVLKRFSTDFPRMRLKLISAPTRRLLGMFSRGEVDLILTTEEECGVGGEILATMPLVWVGAIGGSAWRARPLPVAFCSNCIFRAGVLQVLTESDVDWEMAVDSELDHAVEATVSADLGVHAALKGYHPNQTEEINHGGTLPKLPKQNINLYVQKKEDVASAAMRKYLKQSFCTQPELPKAVTA